MFVTADLSCIAPVAEGLDLIGLVRTEILVGAVADVVACGGVEARLYDAKPLCLLALVVGEVLDPGAEMDQHPLGRLNTDLLVTILGRVGEPSIVPRLRTNAQRPSVACAEEEAIAFDDHRAGPKPAEVQPPVVAYGALLLQNREGTVDTQLPGDRQLTESGTAAK